MENDFISIHSLIRIYDEGGLEQLKKHMFEKHIDFMDSGAYDVYLLLKKRRYDEAVNKIEYLRGLI